MYALVGKHAAERRRAGGDVDIINRRALGAARRIGIAASRKRHIGAAGKPVFRHTEVNHYTVYKHIVRSSFPLDNPRYGGGIHAHAGGKLRLSHTHQSHKIFYAVDDVGRGPGKIEPAGNIIHNLSLLRKFTI